MYIYIYIYISLHHGVRECNGSFCSPLCLREEGRRPRAQRAALSHFICPKLTLNWTSPLYMECREADSTLNPQPSTLNPQPSTLNPQPSTLSPQPPTLNPQPSTLNPQPSTLGSPGYQTGPSAARAEREHDQALS